jgi:hypothetical protein
VRAFWKGRIYMKTIDDDTLDIIQKRLPKTPREILMRDLSAAREDASDAGMMETAATEKEIQVRGEINNIAADKLPPAEKVYDFSLIREILTELAAANWRPTP